MAYDPSVMDGETPTTHSPISQDGTPEIDKEYLIPACEGRAVRLQKGDRLTVINPKGTQVCDFFALCESAPAEFLSMEHCRTSLGRVYVKTGDALVTNRRRPLIEIIEDTSPGVHDILIASCDQPRYQQLGAEGYHHNCADNFRASLLAIGMTPSHVPSPFNIWMNIPVASDGSFSWEEPVSKPGDYITLLAHEATIAVMTACAQDMTPVNGTGAMLSELMFRIER